MTVRLLRAFGGFAAGALYDGTADTELALVNAANAVWETRSAATGGGPGDTAGGTGAGYLGEAADQAAMLALAASVGDECYRTDTGTFWKLAASPASTLANWREQKSAAITTIQMFGNSDNTTRQGTFVVPPGMTSIIASLYGPGGNGGDGAPAHATDYGGGGGGSPGEVLEYAEFPVIPGTTIAYQIGAPGSATYLKRDSHSGDLLANRSVRGATTATVQSGNNGTNGTASVSGGGAAGVGTFYGRTAGASVAGRTTAGNGSNANGLAGTCTLVANRILAFNQPKKVGGLGGGNGALSLSPGGVQRDAGFGANVAIILDGTNGIDGLTGQAGATAGSTTVASGGAGASAIITQFKTHAPAGGGAAASPIAAQGVDAECISCSGSGGAAGTTASVPNVAYGGMGGVGHITIHNWGGSIEEAPPSRVLYSGAGISVPNTFLGLHTQEYGFRLESLTFNTGSDNFTTSVGMYNATLNRRALVFRSGTPPTTAELGVLALNTPYPMLGSASPWQLAQTDGGAAMNITAAGTSPVGEQIDVLGAEMDYAVMRSLSVTATHWGSLHTGDGTYSSTNTDLLDRVKAGLDADGRKLIYVFVGTPDTFASAGPTANAYGTGAQEAPTRSALGDGKIPIRQFVNWLVTRLGSTLAAIEVWNEPRLDGTGNGFFKGSAADMVQIAIDIDAELTLMGSSISLIGPGSSSGSSVFDGIRNRAPTYSTYQFLATQVSGTYGHQVIDGLSLHPYGCLTTSEPPSDVAPFKHDMSRIVLQARRVLQEVGASNYATMPIWFTEVGIDTNGTDLATKWPQLTTPYAALSQVLSAAGAGAHHLNVYSASGTGIEYRYLTRNTETMQVLGDIHRHIAGKTLTYCAVRADGAYMTTTSEEGSAVWAPTYSAV